MVRLMQNLTAALDVLTRLRLEQRLRAIFESSLNLTDRFGLELVPEDVEDAGDWTFLRRTGCHSAQGHFIAHPMPAAALSG